MNFNSLSILLVMQMMLLASGCVPSVPLNSFTPTSLPTSPAATIPANLADRFAGTWAGNMSFTDYEGHNEDVVIAIPTGCITGGVCGGITSKIVHCTWEMTLETVAEHVFQYKITAVSPRGCPLFGEGTLTLQADGTLMAEHTTPLFVATGIFTRE